jgi:hypothetical protein
VNGRVKYKITFCRSLFSYVCVFVCEKLLLLFIEKTNSDFRYIVNPSYNGLMETSSLMSAITE